MAKASFFNIAGAKGSQGDKGEKGADGKSGVKYVRWGRTTCPSGAEVVYKGRDKPFCRIQTNFSIKETFSSASVTGIIYADKHSHNGEFSSAFKISKAGQSPSVELVPEG